MFIFMYFFVSFLSQFRHSFGEYQKLSMSINRKSFFLFIFFLLLIFSTFKEWLCVLVITSAVHVCQFSKARAPVVEVIVVLVAPAAGGVEGA